MRIILPGFFPNTFVCLSFQTKGPFTYANVHQILPEPDNVLDTYQMTGSQVVALVNQAFDSFFPPESNSESYPVGAGIRWYINGSMPTGQKVLSVQVNPRLTGSWTEIDLNATYIVASNTFSSTTSYFGYSEFGAVRDSNPNAYLKTVYSIDQALVQYAKDQGIISDVSPSTYSTQYIVFQDGTVVALSEPPQLTSSAIRKWFPLLVAAGAGAVLALLL